MTRTMLLRSASIGAVLAFGLGATVAQAADKSDCTTKCAPVHHHHKPVHHVAAPNPLAGEVAELKAELASLSQRLDASNAAAQQAQASAAAAQASAAAAQASAQNDDLAIRQIPGDVSKAVAALPKPKTDALYIKGVKFTLGGFIAAESIYRSHAENADISSSYSGIPLNGATHLSGSREWRQTARQSRVSGLAEANVTPSIKLTGYGEFDFQAAAQTANSNESNSYNPRIRHLYTTANFGDYGVELLAGQTWSLATLNNNGITPRAEVTPLTIEAQYVPGFVWARQPQVRLTETLKNGLSFAVSAEQAQTNSVSGTAALNPGYAYYYNAAGGSGFNSANNVSFNDVPDFVGKVAFDQKLEGHKIHLEVLGIYRQMTSRVYNGSVYSNVSTPNGGVGFGVIAQVVPNLLDVQVSGLAGQGVGRYGSAQLPDAYADANGALRGVHERMLLAGVTLHATPAIDVYAYAGQERDQSTSYVTGSTQGGYGNPNFSNAGGCELSFTYAACSGNTKAITQYTIGFWDKAFSGDYGSFRIGAQYSHTVKDIFSGLVAASGLPTLSIAPKGDEDMFYTSIRYYPFQK